MKERDIEAYLVAQVKARGGEVRKVVWPGRKSAPDRVVMLPEMYPEEHARTWPVGQAASRRWRPKATLWIELKAPGKKATFPINAHERAQEREHKRMREVGQVVLVIDSKEEIDKVLW